MATVGAMAVGALALGRVLSRKVSLKNVDATQGPIDDQRVRRTRMREFIRDDVPPPPIR